METPQSLDESRAQQVAAYLRPWPIRLSGLVRYYKQPVCVAHLPRKAQQHFRGILDVGCSTYGRFDDTPRFFPARVKPLSYGLARIAEDTIICHTKPIGDRFSDVPDRWDLYFLLRYQFNHFGICGDRQSASITRTSATWDTILRLHNWEADHPHRRSRLRRLYRNRPAYEIDERYAASALRGVGLVWPGKPHERRRDWVSCVRELGLEVTVGESIRYY